MKKYLKYILPLLLIGLSTAFYLYNKPHQNMEKAQVAMQLHAAQLFDDFDSNETQANTKYLDKIMEVSGKVSAIGKEEDGTISVTLDAGNDMFGVICQLDNLTDHKRDNFTVGENIRFKGICTGMLMDVVLVRCIEITNS